MKITKIHSMFWADVEHTAVGVIADTADADNQLIGTPYSEDSIIWEWVKEFPVSQIVEYVQPVVDEAQE